MNMSYNKPKNTYWSITLSDGTIVTELQKSWKDYSTLMLVKYFDSNKQVYLSNVTIASITVVLNKLTTTIDVPSDCRVYQSIMNETSQLQDGESRTTIVGRLLGLVKNGEVVEERFLNSFANEITGFKK